MLVAGEILENQGRRAGGGVGSLIVEQTQAEREMPAVLASKHTNNHHLPFTCLGISTMINSK